MVYSTKHILDSEWEKLLLKAYFPVFNKEKNATLSKIFSLSSGLTVWIEVFSEHDMNL